MLNFSSDDISIVEVKKKKKKKNKKKRAAKNEPLGVIVFRCSQPPCRSRCVNTGSYITNADIVTSRCENKEFGIYSIYLNVRSHITAAFDQFR